MANALAEQQSVHNFALLLLLSIRMTYGQCVIAGHKIRETISHAFGAKCATTKAQDCIAEKNAKTSACKVHGISLQCHIRNYLEQCCKRFVSNDDRATPLSGAHIFHGITAKFIEIVHRCKCGHICVHRLKVCWCMYATWMSDTTLACLALSI